MKLILVVAFLAVTFIGCECDLDITADFDRLCTAERAAKKVFDNFLGEEATKIDYFNNYMEIRKKRVELGYSLKQTCSDLSGAEDLEDKQVLAQFCQEERVFKAYEQKNEDKLLDKRLALMYRESFDRLSRFIDRLGLSGDGSTICPMIDNLDLSKFETLAARLKDQFYANCKLEAFYDYISRKITQVSFEAMVSAPVYRLDELTTIYLKHSRARREFCMQDIRECCGAQLVDDSRNDAIVRTAEILIEIGDAPVEFQRKIYESNIHGISLEKNFERLCAIEHKTSSSDFYQARESTLKTIHRRVVKARKTLQKALGFDKCPSEVIKALESDHKVTPLPKIVVNSKCEDEHKSRLMCQAFKEARQAKTSAYSSSSFMEEQKKWCEKYEKTLIAKNSGKKVYKPPDCNEQVLAYIQADAQTEAKVVLDLLELEESNKSAAILKDLVPKQMEFEYDFLSKVEKVYRNEVIKQTSVLTNQHVEAALQLIRDKLVQLKTSTTKKSPKFSLLRPSTWF